MVSYMHIAMYLILVKVVLSGEKTLKKNRQQKVTPYFKEARWSTT